MTAVLKTHSWYIHPKSETLSNFHGVGTAQHILFYTAAESNTKEPDLGYSLLSTIDIYIDYFPRREIERADNAEILQKHICCHQPGIIHKYLIQPHPDL